MSAKVVKKLKKKKLSKITKIKFEEMFDIQNQETWEFMNEVQDKELKWK